ncbi:nuclear transport factor 2 family protein [Caenimonas soli]|uniref:nuclear transport factor 2 family protein n=1 Tax=Caenimonas soli TaxID=2735555 RepID=UPI0015546556|nr:nuclear transport factor 2 family protein [Caenimonas soli]NPC57864.1 nuclear transport factor 2 family protein [Caenimonas soli]
MTAPDAAAFAALQQQVHALKAQVERFDSIEAIRSLRARYHELVNEDAGPRLYELFAPDAAIVYGGRPEVRGRENIRAFFASFPVQSARQFIHNHVVDVEGNHGTGFSYLDGRPVRDGKSYYVVGRFDDEYIRIDGQWMFQRVVLSVHYMIEAAERWDDLIPLKKN